MQFKLRGGTETALIGVLVVMGVSTAGADPALAKATKKHPKGFVHDTAGDGAPQTPSAASYGQGGTPKWIQYDWGGLYYYQHNEIDKARQYWLESLKLAEHVVPAERAKGLTAKTAAACCELIRHLSFFVDDTKFRPKTDGNYGASVSDPVSNNGNQSPQRQLDNIKSQLREQQQDWDWYERICNFADRAIGKQRDCMRQIYNQRAVFERKIIMTRQAGQLLERQLGIDLRQSTIDMRPLKWGGVEGAGNPFDTPNSNTIPVNLRGGAQPSTVGPSNSP